MSATTYDPFTDGLLHRIYSEFLEMPGLRLTCAQAQRLWGLDEPRCRRALQYLIDVRFLHRPAHGMYQRLSDGDTGHLRRLFDRLATPRHEVSAANGGSQPHATRPNTSTEDDVELAAHLQVPVLVTAPQREERDRCARLIHASGDGARGPFVTSSWPAPGGNGTSDHRLRHQYANARNGSLFIDDVTTLNDAAQQELLSLLEHCMVTGPRHYADRRPARIISGASHHVGAELARGTFSNQLFYRLNVVHIDLTARPVRTSEPATVTVG